MNLYRVGEQAAWDEPTKIFTHENDVYSTGLSMASYGIKAFEVILAKNKKYKDLATVRMQMYVQ